jgi:hypothetical protein
VRLEHSKRVGAFDDNFEGDNVFWEALVTISLRAARSTL